jgi:uncharacterized OB-fold protein
MPTPAGATETAPASAPTRIAPIVTPDAEFFWKAADRAEFVGQKCGECGQYTFPPRPMCPNCHSLKREVVPLSGQGTVQSWTLPRHPPAFGFKEPPIVAVIRLKEGVNFVSNVVGVRVEDLKIGMPVQVLFEPTLGNHRVPVFKPADE